MSKIVFIYALTCPDTDEVKYVGRTHNPQSRLATHLAVRQNNKSSKWIRSLLAEGKRPGLKILEEVPISEQVEAEGRWLQHYRSIGASLTNTLMHTNGMKASEIERSRFTVDISDELNTWLTEQARLSYRTKNQQLDYILSIAQKMPLFSNEPRHTLNSPKMCYNGQHHFKQADPAASDFCNCGVFVFGEVIRSPQGGYGSL